MKDYSRRQTGRKEKSDSSRPAVTRIHRWRYLFVVLLLLGLPVLALNHIAGLQVLPNADRGFEFLQGQSAARTVREESIAAYRGVITDRNGVPLAVSSPVLTLWANPEIINNSELHNQPDILAQLCNLLDIEPKSLLERLDRYANKEFMYLARHLSPEKAEQVMRLEIPGINAKVEYKRFYPAGEVTAHLVGFTNIDEQGQEGLELAYDEVLKGVPGVKKVMKDLKGRVIKDISLVRAEKPGQNIALSIDLRLQYAAYRELKEGIRQHRAQAGSVVILDVETGEVLAMVNQPSYNPNDRGQLSSDALRNRAVTDLQEPGSLMKPLTIAAALETGRYNINTTIDTSPGWVSLGRKTFYDHSNYGVLTLAEVLKKSSQVGTSKLAMELDPDHVRDVFARVGIGESPGTGFPGESPGSLPQHRVWRAVERANFAFGYGLSASALQIAQAYSVLADDGQRKNVSLLKVEQAPERQQVIAASIADTVRHALVSVTETGGTATRAVIPGYRVSGKTGTVHKVGSNGYQENRYVSLFAGMAPVDNPRLVTVVIIDDPQEGGYYGGLVAAPVFSGVTERALRLLNVSPDQSIASKGQLAIAGGAF